MLVSVIHSTSKCQVGVVASQIGVSKTCLLQGSVTAVDLSSV